MTDYWRHLHQCAAIVATWPAWKRGEGAMGERGWKKFERRISRDHGCERQPVTGEREAGDSKEHPLFAFQMKLRKAIPKSIREWSDGICRTAKRDGKIGVLIVKEPGLHDENALVILKYRDWVDLHGARKCCQAPECCIDAKAGAEWCEHK